MSKQNKYPRKAYVLCGIAILLWGSVSTIGKLFLKDAPVIEFLFYMSFFASATLLLGLVLQNKIKDIFSQSLTDYLKLSLIGIVGILIYNVLYFEALTRTSAANVSIIGSVWPIILVIFSSILLKRKSALTGWLALLLGFAGVFLATLDNLSFTTNFQRLTGDFLVLCSALIFALFFMLSNKYKSNNYLFMFFCYLSSFIASGVYLLLTQGFSQSSSFIIPALYIGALPSAVGFAFFSEALNKGNITRIANLANLTPFVSLVYIALVLKENPSLLQLLGLIILICAIMLERIIELTRFKLSSLRRNLV